MTIATSPPTDTDIAIIAAAERIAEGAINALIGESTIGTIRDDVQRIAEQELRRIDERAYRIGIRHATIVPEIIPDDDDQPEADPAQPVPDGADVEQWVNELFQPDPADR